MLPTEVRFPSASPSRGRNTLCGAQHPTTLSRGAAELGLAGSLCQGCGKGLPPARGSLQTGCQEASAALHVLVMLVIEAKTQAVAKVTLVAAAWGAGVEECGCTKEHGPPQCWTSPREAAQTRLMQPRDARGVQICLPPSAQQQWELWLQLADVQPLGSPLCQAQRRDMHHGCWNRPFL